MTSWRFGFEGPEDWTGADRPVEHHTQARPDPGIS